MTREEMAALLQSKYANVMAKIYPHAPEEISNMLAGAYCKAVRLASLSRTDEEVESDLLVCLELISSQELANSREQKQPSEITATVDIYRQYAIPQLGGYPSKSTED